MQVKNIDREKLLRRYLEIKLREGAYNNFISKPLNEQRHIARETTIKRAEQYRSLLTKALIQSNKERAVSANIMRYLKQSKENIFNTENTPVSLRILSQDLHEDINLIRKVSGKLALENKIQAISFGSNNLFYRLK